MWSILGLAILALLLAIPVLFIYIIFAATTRLWKWAGSGRPLLRIAVVAITLLAFASPYLAFKFFESRFVLRHVPEPLHVASIEYRKEESWGFGMPGDNETGLIVYRLTNESSDWARGQGNRLGEILARTDKLYSGWEATPIDPETHHHWRYDKAPDGHPKRPSIVTYLDAYGFSIPIDAGYRAEVDRAIQSPGSYYAYGRGGTLIVIDPRRGKVYFAYAG